MINVGIIGYGFAGRGFHAYLIGRVPELRLTAVASRDPARRRRAEQDYSVATYATVDDLLERSGVDLVVVATPHDTHAALTCQALNAGKHVVVDKVMCLTAAEADTMIAAAQRNDRLLSVFQNRRWDWDFLTVRQVLADGLLGAPYLIEASVARYRPPRGWRGEVDASGGLLYDWGAHLIDHALQLVPEPVVSVTCDLQHRGWGAAIGSYARLLLRFAGGLLYSIELGNLARLDRPRWVVLGERGALVKHGLDPQEPAMLAGNIDAATEAPDHRARIRTDLNGLTSKLVIDSMRGDWTDYYHNIAATLAGRAELAVTPEQARRALTVFDAAMQSARTGTAVRLER
ncbi:MAG: Gfo/Idh/MocA family oxidoreductase [Chloroflexi bacterium]|nr:Gfo/Idh/MocA family oxidoreductase [Chloroflexota bacterium]